MTKCNNKDCKKRISGESISIYCEDHEIIDYYYNPNLECTCKALFADTHREHCRRRIRPRKEGESR